MARTFVGRATARPRHGLENRSKAPSTPKRLGLPAAHHYPGRRNLPYGSFVARAALAPGSVEHGTGAGLPVSEDFFWEAAVTDSRRDVAARGSVDTAHRGGAGAAVRGERSTARRQSGAFGAGQLPLASTATGCYLYNNLNILSVIGYNLIRAGTEGRQPRNTRRHGLYRAGLSGTFVMVGFAPCKPLGRKQFHVPYPTHRAWFSLHFSLRFIL